MKYGEYKKGKKKETIQHGELRDDILPRHPQLNRRKDYILGNLWGKRPLFPTPFYKDLYLFLNRL